MTERENIVLERQPRTVEVEPIFDINDIVIFRRGSDYDVAEFIGVGIIQKISFDQEKEIEYQIRIRIKGEFVWFWVPEKLICESGMDSKTYNKLYEEQKK